MMHIKSTTMLVVFLMATLMGPTTAHAAPITPYKKSEIIASFLVIFGRGPSQAELAGAITAVENGNTTAQAMTSLSAAIPEYALIASKDADSFALYLTNSLLSPDTSVEARDWSINWVITQLQGTLTRIQVAVEAVQALRASTNSAYASAKTQLNEDVAAVQSNLGATDKAVVAKSLDELLEIAEDLKIEEEDNSQYYKDALADHMKRNPDSKDTLVLPSKLHAELKKLETELKSATSDSERKAVNDKLTVIHTSLQPWLLVGSTNQGTELKESARIMNDAALANIRAVNDRVTATLTGGGKTCSSVYNSTTHSYQQVCH